jgi:HAD superfamily hydrolase (TIGR01509 family)
MSVNTLEKLAILKEKTAGKYKALLYDCDGTLADNMLAHKLSYKEAAAKYGIDLDTNIIDELAGWPTRLVAEEISKRYQTYLPDTFSKEKTAVFFDKYIERTEPIAFVTEHLKSNFGKAHIAVVSGGTRTTVQKTLSVLGLTEYIDVLICAGETPNGKPYPDPFLAAAKTLKVNPSECVVFEDGDPGVTAAIAAGMDWIRIDKI